MQQARTGEAVLDNCTFPGLPKGMCRAFGRLSGYLLGGAYFTSEDSLFHLAVLCDSLRCRAYGALCYGIS